MFLKLNNIDFTPSQIFSLYFSDFKFDQELASMITQLNVVEFGKLENILELLIPDADRSINGAFFTPPYIVEHIVREINPDNNDLILDPSCGCGAFLVGAVRFLRNKHGLTIKKILRNLFGADILSYNINRTKLLLASFGLMHEEILEETDFNLIVADSLKHDWLEKFDCIIGNPPYVKYQDLSDDNRVFLKDSFESIGKGTFNLYFAFFELGYELLTPNGKLGYITPNNYFTSLAGETLRRYFRDKQCCFKIIDFNHFMVFDAQTYTCLSFVSKARCNTILFDKMFVDDHIGFLNDLEFSKVPLSELNPQKWRLLRDNERHVIKQVETCGTPLGDLFTISVGIATLKDSLFIVDAENGKYIKDVDGEKIELEAASLKSLYKISTFDSQSDVDHNQKKIIFPYEVINGKAKLYSEEYMKESYPNTWRYLCSIRSQIEKRGKVVVDPFYMYGRSQGLNKFGIRLLTPTFSQHPKFLLVREVDSLYCNGYGLHFIPQLDSMSLFGENPIQQERNIDILQRILNSEIMDFYVKNTSVSIQGGYPCYQKNFIERFSIPPIQEDTIAELRLMSDDDFTAKLKEIYGVEF